MCRGTDVDRPQHQLRRQLDPRGHRRSALGELHEDPSRLVPQFLERLAHRAQGRTGHGRDQGVVEGHDGQIARYAEPLLACGLQHAEGLRVAGREDGGGRLGGAEDLEAGGQRLVVVEVGGADDRRVVADTGFLQGRPVAVQASRPGQGVRAAGDHADPGVPEPEEVLHRVPGAVPVGHPDARDVQGRRAERVDQHHREALLDDAALVLLGQHRDHDDQPGGTERHALLQPPGDGPPTRRPRHHVDTEFAGRVHDSAGDFQRVGPRHVPEHRDDLPGSGGLRLPRADVPVARQQLLHAGPGRRTDVTAPVHDLGHGAERHPRLGGDARQQPVLRLQMSLALSCHPMPAPLPTPMRRKRIESLVRTSAAS